MHRYSEATSRICGRYDSCTIGNFSLSTSIDLMMFYKEGCEVEAIHYFEQQANENYQLKIHLSVRDYTFLVPGKQFLTINTPHYRRDRRRVQVTSCESFNLRNRRAYSRTIVSAPSKVLRISSYPASGVLVISR
jgi:hypothetical protein